MVEKKKEKSVDVKRYIRMIDAHDARMAEYYDRCHKIKQNYLSSRVIDGQDNRFSYNIFWSNINTLVPALYNKPPCPYVGRRHKDDGDELGGVLSVVLQRCAKTILDTNHVDVALRQVVENYTVYGRAVLWFRYDAEITQTDELIDKDNEEEGYKEKLEREQIKFDVLAYDEFGHDYAKAWDKVTCVWKKVFLNRGELIARFGKEKGEDIALDSVDSNRESTDVDKNNCSKALIYEIWDKKKRGFAGYPKPEDELLDKKEKFSPTEDFFPCPRPLYSTLDEDGLIPVPDYVYYKEQIDELNLLNSKIHDLIDQLNLKGVFDATHPEIRELLKSDNGNMIAIKDMMKFNASGGIDKLIQFLPLSDVANALQIAQSSINGIKAEIYEILGIADFMRGQGRASESASLTNEKGNYASMRIKERQSRVSLFMRDCVEILVQFIAKKLTSKTLAEMSNVKLLEDEEQKQALEVQYQYAKQMGQTDSKLEEVLSKPTWDELEKLMKDNNLRNYRIDIETYETAKQDEATDRQERMAAASAIGQYLREAVPAAQANPQLAPILGKMFKFIVSGFKIGSAFEDDIDVFVTNLEKMAQQPPPPKPNEFEEKAKAQMQVDNNKVQGEIALQNNKLQSDAQKDIADKQHSLEVEKMKAEMQSYFNTQLENLKGQIKSQQEQFKAQISLAQEQERTAREERIATQRAESEMIKTQIANSNKGE